MINRKELDAFISVPVQITIQGELEEEKAPWVNKTIQKVELCPDQTHLRLYFDDMYFFAVPLSSSVTEQSSINLIAYDKGTCLYYMIKKREQLP